MSEIKEIREAFLDQLYVRGFIDRENYKEAIEFFCREIEDENGELPRQLSEAERGLVRDADGWLVSPEEIASDNN